MKGPYLNVKYTYFHVRLPSYISCRSCVIMWLITKRHILHPLFILISSLCWYQIMGFSIFNYWHKIKWPPSHSLLGLAGKEKRLVARFYTSPVGWGYLSRSKTFLHGHDFFSNKLIVCNKCMNYCMQELQRQPLFLFKYTIN